MLLPIRGNANKCDRHIINNTLMINMSKLLRYPKISDIYFITCVTHNRIPILHKNYSLLVKAFFAVRRRKSIKLLAWIVLPDHFHCLVDSKNNSISDILQQFKMSFGALYRGAFKVKKGNVWQKRFWDHMIRNQEDYNRHMDYIHYNPVKHGLCKNPFHWPYSSLNLYSDCYPNDWGVDKSLTFEKEFGE
ncbi:MAG: transposase [Candidatus Zixiibacteriota bacterium]